MQINPDTVNPFIWTQSPVSRLVLNCFCYREMYQLIGSLSNNDGDGNEDGKKAVGLDQQNDNFARASRFFAHFFAVAARLQRESASISRFVEDAEHKTTTFFFFS